MTSCRTSTNGATPPRSFVESPLCEPLPEAAPAVDAADLLPANGRVPFGVKLNDDTTGLAQVRPLTANRALRDENPRRGSGAVERGLKVASRLPSRRALQQSRVKALPSVLLLEHRAQRLLPEHGLLLVHVLVAQLAKERAKPLL